MGHFGIFKPLILNVWLQNFIFVPVLVLDNVGLAYVFVSQHVLRLKCCIVQLIKYVINKISQSCNVKQVYNLRSIYCYLACLRVINHVMKQGAVKANTVGSIAVMYSGFGVILAWLRGTEDELNTIVSATTTGLIYRSTGTITRLTDCHQNVYQTMLDQIIFMAYLVRVRFLKKKVRSLFLLCLSSRAWGLFKEQI